MRPTYTQEMLNPEFAVRLDPPLAAPRYCGATSCGSELGQRIGSTPMLITAYAYDVVAGIIAWTEVCQFADCSRMAVEQSRIDLCCDSLSRAVTGVTWRGKAQSRNGELYPQVRSSYRVA